MRRGFSLVETVVTIAIIAVLVAILVPALRGVSDMGRATQCTSNLRQMWSAAQSYAMHHDDAYPAAIIYGVGPGGMQVAAWDFIQEVDGEVRPGAMWSYADRPNEVLQCPSFDGASTFGNDPACGYNYNTTYIGAEGHLPMPDANVPGGWIEGWNNARRGVPASSHRRPSETALFGDAGWKLGANKFMRAPSNQVENDLASVYAGGQAFRHGEATHVAYLDGHVCSCTRCCAGIHATEELCSLLLDYPRNGFLSEDDSAYDPR